MKKIIPSSTAWKKSWIQEPNLVWGAIALAVWAGVQCWHVQKGTDFSPAIFLKGLLILAAATGVYQLSAGQKFSFLGLFPLLWLAVSRFQWDLCAASNFHYWLWLFLFLVSECVILLFPDGKKLLWVLIPTWVLLAWLFPFSFFLPLVFITAERDRFKRADWAKWGGLLTGLALAVLFQGWRSFHLDWIRLYDLMVAGRFIAFFFLGWLGLAAFPKKGTFRSAVFPWLLLTLGFLFWQSVPPLSEELELYQWTLVFFAGFGWESFRRDVMDPSWHGTAVWASVGFALFFGLV